MKTDFPITSDINTLDVIALLQNGFNKETAEAIYAQD